MAVPSDGEEMHLVPRENPPPRLLATAASAAPPVALPAPAKWSVGKLVAIILGVGVLMALAIVAVGYIYRHESPHPERPLSVLKTIREHLPTPPAAPLTITPDLLHVSSISLGSVRVAIVNGKRLEEGKWLEVRTSDGVAALRVSKIEDGVVHFRYAGQRIAAKLVPEELTEKKSPR